MKNKKTVILFFFLYLFLFIKVVAQVQSNESQKKIDSLLQVSEIQKQNKDWRQLAESYNEIAKLYYRGHQDKKAVAYYLMVDSLNQKQPNLKAPTVDALVGLNKILLLRGELDSTIFLKRKNNLDRALQYAIDIKSPYSQAKVFLELGFLYGKIEDKTHQSKNYHKALRLLDQSEKDENSIILKSSLYSEISRYHYHKMKDIDSAEYYLQKSVNLLENSQLNDKLPLAFSQIGGFYKLIKNYDKSIEYLNKALDEINKNKDLPVSWRRGTLEDLAFVHSEINQPQKAFDYLYEAYLLNDSISKIENKNIALEMESKYQTQQKEQEIALLKTDKNLIQRQKDNQRNLLVGGLIISSLIGIFLFTLYKNRQKSNLQLKEIDLLKSKMLTNLSHEFRTPITVIQGLSNNLSKSSLNEKDQSTIETIQKNASLLNEQLKQILAIAALEKENLTFHYVNQDLVVFIDSLCRLFNSYAKSKKQHISFQSNAQKLPIDFDPDKIQTIVQNLISNALKFNQENGEIRVELIQENDFYHISISDDGMGIKPENINKIFERFYTSSTENNPEGTGIGLAIVKELVERMNGTIQVNSQIGKGTTFIVRFPISQNAQTPSQKVKPKLPFVYTYKDKTVQTQPIHPPVSPSLTIMIVEDNKDIQLYYKQTLSDAYKIVQAQNGKQALELLEKKEIDLIISDISMSEMDGFEFSKQLKSNIHTSHIPLIVVSAHTEIDAKTKGYELGIDAYLAKPFKEQELLSIIRNLFKKQEEKNSYFSKLLELKSVDKEITVHQVEITFVKNLQELALESQIYTTEEIAQKMAMSRSKLNHKVKTLTGKSVANYIKSIKIEKAKELLKNTDLQINEIGYDLGYEDPSLFSKVFKKETGKTPKQFRH